MIDDIKKALSEYKGNWNEKKGVFEFKSVIAERKAFLSKKKLTYSSSMRIDDDKKIVHFSEMLIEAGSGLSSGGGFDDGISPGFGFKTESYNTLKPAREGSIKEQSTLFGKTYQYDFDYEEIRKKIENIAQKVGYKFQYQILPVK